MPVAVLTTGAAMAVVSASVSTVSKQPATTFTGVPGQRTAFR